MRRVAKAFDLKDGDLYMNRTSGTQDFRSIYAEPFYGRGSLVIDGMALARQAGALVTVPMIGTMKALNDKGYRLRIQDENYTYYPDKWGNVMTSSEVPACSTDDINVFHKTPRSTAQDNKEQVHSDKKSGADPAN